MSAYPLKAGAALGDITPDETLFPIPYFLTIEIDRVIDPIHVRGLDIDDGAHRALFITFDTIAVPRPDETLKFICEQTGLDEEYVFMAATHTHTVPVLGIEGITAKDSTQKHQ